MKRYKKIKSKISAGLSRSKLGLPLRKSRQPRDSEGRSPRITNDTVAVHREEVLSSARKYIYPLQHSKRKVVVISFTLFLAAVVAFFIYCGLALYKFQSTSSFMYGVTRVFPFPVAKAGPRFVSYESYLFELRHYMHYYHTQQQVNFDTDAGKQQLEEFKKQSLQQVINDAYIKQLAEKNGVSVSNKEVTQEVNLVREQNRLGSNDAVFQNVLKEFWGWSVDDFRRELRQQILQQKVVSSLDAGTHQRAEAALKRIEKGEDFANVAKAVSDDTSTKSDGGTYTAAIGRSNRDIPPQVVEALFNLKPGQHSAIINAGYSLEIVKMTGKENNKAKGAHISFNFKDISTYTEPLKSHQKPSKYIQLGE